MSSRTQWMRLNKSKPLATTVCTRKDPGSLSSEDQSASSAIACRKVLKCVDEEDGKIIISDALVIMYS
jgi:hypothetical protein